MLKVQANVCTDHWYATPVSRADGNILTAVHSFCARWPAVRLHRRGQPDFATDSFIFHSSQRKSTSSRLIMICAPTIGKSTNMRPSS